MKGDPRHSSRILDSIPDHLSVEFSGGSRGRARGSPPAPPLFLDQTEARRAEKIFLVTAPLPHLSQGLDDPPPPPFLSEGFNPPLELHSVFQLLTGFQIHGAELRTPDSTSRKVYRIPKFGLPYLRRSLYVSWVIAVLPIH